MTAAASSGEGDPTFHSRSQHPALFLPAAEQAGLFHFWFHHIFLNGKVKWSPGHVLNLVIFYPTNKENKGIILCPISSHIFGDIDTKPSRGDRPWPNLGPEICEKLPGVTSCQL